MAKGDVERYLLSRSQRDQKTGCLNWTGCLTKTTSGYGLINVRSRGRKTTTVAHRVAYRIWVRPVPKRMKVLHSCDNTRCIEPDHLFVGTQLGNVRDCIKKNRRGRLPSEDWPTAKLTRRQVERIRQLYTGLRGDLSRLANRFGVRPNTIKSIVQQVTWKNEVCNVKG